MCVRQFYRNKYWLMLSLMRKKWVSRHCGNSLNMYFFLLALNFPINMSMWVLNSSRGRLQLKAIWAAWSLKRDLQTRIRQLRGANAGWSMTQNCYWDFTQFLRCDLLLWKRGLMEKEVLKIFNTKLDGICMSMVWNDRKECHWYGICNIGVDLYC